MNPDLLVYVQQGKDGMWRVWHAFASLTAPDDAHCVYVDTDKGAAKAAAYTYCMGTEYQVCELPPDAR